MSPASNRRRACGPARSGAFASQAVEWSRPTPLQRAARRPTQACLGQRIGSELRQKGMAQRYLAGGSNAPLASRFAAVRVHLAARDDKRTTPHPVEWLLVEWPKGEAAPTKYWLSTLPEDTPLATLVDYAKLRWRIERDYEELKGELGLSHYEGRGWRGFHHHATLCIAAYGFSISERTRFPLSLPAAHDASTTRRLSTPRRRRSVPNATSKTRSRRSENASPSRSQIPRAMSMLSVDATTTCNPIAFMTQ